VSTGNGEYLRIFWIAASHALSRKRDRLGSATQEAPKLKGVNEVGGDFRIRDEGAPRGPLRLSPERLPRPLAVGSNYDVRLPAFICGA